jgi:ubiquitin C-terminal hydrolase
MAIVVPIQYNGFSSEALEEEADDDNFSVTRNNNRIENTSNNDDDDDDDGTVVSTTNNERNGCVVGTMEINNSTNIQNRIQFQDDTENTNIDYSLFTFNDDNDDGSLPDIVDHDDVNDETPATPTPTTAIGDVDIVPDDVDNDDYDMLLSSPSATTASLPYGGLYNLGNTCYMSSALQMLASLDKFVSDLKTRTPTSSQKQKQQQENDDEEDIRMEDERDSTQQRQLQEVRDTSTSSSKSSSTSIRDALLDVLEKLANGETIRPDTFKHCIDERTSLFLGYRQQDSHEFLTTLLDLIDEEYKVKDEEKDTKHSEHEENDDNSDINIETSSDDSNNNDTEDQDMNDDNDELHQSTINVVDECSMVDETPTLLVSHPLLHHEDVQRTDDSTNESVEEMETVRRTSSYKDLDCVDIENLLFGDNHSNNDSFSNFVSTKERQSPYEQEPKYKLVGGRMNTSHADLTPYEHCNDYNMEASSSVNHDTTAATSNKLEEEEDVAADDDDDDMSETSAVAESPSPVESNFKTEVRVCLTCESCKYRRSQTETYLHLSLEIGSSDASVEDGLRKFFAPEKREVKCEKCFHSSAVQTMVITKLPTTLLLHLKRFIVDISPDYTSISYRKNRSSVSFEERMPLENDGDCIFEEFLAPDVAIPKGSAYAIRSVVNHIGMSASCGHYTADAKHLYKTNDDAEDEETREWTRFNDSYVSKIDSDSINNETAYMIMYELEQ